MNCYDTLSEALDAARRQGYSEDFAIHGGRLKALNSGKVFDPGDVTIVDHHRFEGPSSEDDKAVIYFIECADGGKGVIVDAFGTYADSSLSEFLRDVNVNET